MKGRYTTGQAEVGEFIIILDDYLLWAAPRGRSARYGGGWTTDVRKAEVYKSWQSAGQAIDRYIKKGNYDFKRAKYLTVMDWNEFKAGINPLSSVWTNHG